MSGIDLGALPIGAALVTRDGRRARLICKDRKGDAPFIALVPDKTGDEWAVRYRPDGTAAPYDGTASDIVAVAPRIVRVRVVFLEHQGATPPKETAIAFPEGAPEFVDVWGTTQFRRVLADEIVGLTLKDGAE